MKVESIQVLFIQKKDVEYALDLDGLIGIQ